MAYERLWKMFSCKLYWCSIWQTESMHTDHHDPVMGWFYAVRLGLFKLCPFFCDIAFIPKTRPFWELNQYSVLLTKASLLSWVLNSSLSLPSTMGLLKSLVISLHSKLQLSASFRFAWCMLALRVGKCFQGKTCVEFSVPFSTGPFFVQFCFLSIHFCSPELQPLSPTQWHTHWMLWPCPPTQRASSCYQERAGQLWNSPWCAPFSQGLPHI